MIEMLGMSGAFEIVALVFFFAIGLPVICGTLIAMVKILKVGGRKERKTTADETRVIQDLHADMEKLENRIESLEGILIQNKDK